MKAPTRLSITSILLLIAASAMLMATPSAAFLLPLPIKPAAFAAAVVAKKCKTARCNKAAAICKNNSKSKLCKTRKLALIAKKRKQKKLIATCKKIALRKKLIQQRERRMMRLPPPPPAPLAFGTLGTTALLGGIGLASAALKQVNDAQSSTPFMPEFASLVDQTIVITGASTGLGLESAQRLASAGANLVLTARTRTKGEGAVKTVRDFLVSNGYNYDGQDISFRILDLDSLESVRTANEWEFPNGKIDVLLNNAGIMAPPKREVTVDGIERQMQSNHLGHFVLTGLLSSKFSDDARIISVSSLAHRGAMSNGMEFDYMWKAESGYDAWKSYAQSKLANIYFTQELQRRAAAAGKEWTAVTLHPGLVNSELGRYTAGDANSILEQVQSNLPDFIKNATESISFLKTPEEGASTQIFLASRAETEDAKGQYFVDCKARPLLDFATNQESAKQLWEESEKLGGVDFIIVDESEQVEEA